MPIYVYRCECGLRFERLTSFDAAAPACPACGGDTRKVPAGFSLGGQAERGGAAGLSMDRMPQTWRGVYNGNREYLGQMRRQWERRQRLEAKYPEIAGDQRPILAHEGRYHDAPLRAGDPLPGTGHGHGHGHGHGSGGGSDSGGSRSGDSGTGGSGASTSGASGSAGSGSGGSGSAEPSSGSSGGSSGSPGTSSGSSGASSGPK